MTAIQEKHTQQKNQQQSSPLLVSTNNALHSTANTSDNETHGEVEFSSTKTLLSLIPVALTSCAIHSPVQKVARE